MTSEPCPDDALTELLAIAADSDDRGLDRIAILLKSYGGDARLHFLRGSLLAGLRRYDEAHGAMKTAVDLAPDFAVARFQLGLLELTSGAAAQAQATWEAFRSLPSDNPYYVFSEGLTHLIRDEFQAAIESLERGIGLNSENPAINADMQLIIAETRKKMSEQTEPEEEPHSPTQALLRQFGRKPTHH